MAHAVEIGGKHVIQKHGLFFPVEVAGMLEIPTNPSRSFNPRQLLHGPVPEDDLSRPVDGEGGIGKKIDDAAQFRFAFLEFRPGNTVSSSLAAMVLNSAIMSRTSPDIPGSMR
jgi:hypothetical protein